MGCHQSKTPATSAAVNGEHKKESRRSSIVLSNMDGRIECSDETTHAVLAGAKLRYAYFSQRGYYPDDEDKPNQDAHCIRNNFCSSDSDCFLAVFDGHGRYGDKCAQFAKTNLPPLVERAVQQMRRKSSGSASKSNRPGRTILADMTKEDYETACLQAHLECNRMMHRATTFDDSLSGTTAISLTLHGDSEITVCNVGDSRAIMGQQVPAVSNSKNGPTSGGTIYRAMPLSLDQTPYRRDERHRVRDCGARILSLDQIEGLEPIDDDSVEDGEDIQLGETIDEGGDPPRVWSPNGEYPGTAFTRSIGDVIAEELGVCAEPEMITRQLTPDDKIIVLASDGVFEFLTNQSVIDICAKFDDPLEACRAVVAESYELWLQYELRTDDITMICIFVDDILPSPEPPLERPVDRESFLQLSSETGSCRDLKELMVPLEGMRPVRHAASKTKIKAIQRMKNSTDAKDESDEEDFDITELMTEKSDDDKARISEAIKASVIFKDVSDQQREMIYSVMEHVSVKKGDWVIRQGEMGDHFYIVETGKFEVRIVPEGATDDDGTGGNLVHLYVGSRTSHAHPSFGELALMYSAPRAASIIAQTDGHLWALHRSVFKKVLSEHNFRRTVRQNMRKLRPFKTLTTDEVQKLVDSMDEVNFKEGETIVTQGENGDTFYFVVKGSCEQTIMPEKSAEDAKDCTSKIINANGYFGEPMLLRKGKYEGTVVALASTKCLKLKLATVQQTVGSLVGRSGRA